MIGDVFERHVDGTDPFAIEALTRRIRCEAIQVARTSRSWVS
jgi:hypothetical protein